MWKSLAAGIGAFVGYKAGKKLVQRKPADYLDPALFEQAVQAIQDWQSNEAHAVSTLSFISEMRYDIDDAIKILRQHPHVIQEMIGQRFGITDRTQQLHQVSDILYDLAHDDPKIERLMRAMNVAPIYRRHSTLNDMERALLVKNMLVSMSKQEDERTCTQMHYTVLNGFFTDDDLSRRCLIQYKDDPELLTYMFGIFHAIMQEDCPSNPAKAANWIFNSFDGAQNKEALQQIFESPEVMSYVMATNRSQHTWEEIKTAW